MSKTYRNLLVFELVVIFIVTLIFRLIADRLTAGQVAGIVFVAMGAAVFFSAWRDWRRARFGLASLITGGVFLFGVALPMLITRQLNAGAEFSSVRVLGLPGPVFHRLSTWVYLLMMAATAWDWWRSRRLAKAK